MTAPAQLELAYQPKVREARYPSEKAVNQRVILEALRRGERLTVGDALERYQVYALSQEVGRLKALGWEIQTETITLPNAKRVSCYWIAA